MVFHVAKTVDKKRNEILEEIGFPFSFFFHRHFLFTAPYLRSCKIRGPFALKHKRGPRKFQIFFRNIKLYTYHLGAYLNEPPSEAVVVDGADVAPAVAGVDHGSGVVSVGVVADPALRTLVLIWHEQEKHDGDQNINVNDNNNYSINLINECGDGGDTSCSS